MAAAAAVLVVDLLLQPAEAQEAEPHLRQAVAAVAAQLLRPAEAVAVVMDCRATSLAVRVSRHTLSL